MTVYNQKHYQGEGRQTTLDGGLLLITCVSVVLLLLIATSLHLTRSLWTPRYIPQVAMEPEQVTVNLETPEPVKVVESSPLQEPLTSEPSLEPEKTQEPAKGKISKKWPEEIQQWSGLLTKYGKQASVDPDLAASVMFVESWFNSETYPAGFQRCPDGPSSMSCTSYAGAMCALQVMPFHAGPGENLRDPDTCISKGVSILQHYISRMGSVRGGLGAYQCGETGLKNNRCGASGGYVYADKVLGIYEQFRKK